MPLPPLPANNTARVWFRYVTNSGTTAQTHEVMWRANLGDFTIGDVGTNFLDLLTAIGASNFRTGWRVLSGRYSPAGAVFSVPAVLPAALLAFTGTGTSAGYRLPWEAVQDVFVGRSLSSGRKVSFSLFRAAGEADDTFRYGMPGAVQTALSTGSGNGAPLAIDGTNPSWYTYTNQNYNSYWERELRS